MEFCYSKDHCPIPWTLFEDKGTWTVDKERERGRYLGYNAMVTEPSLY